jgi:transitional endoplasmic reticulum ATPase
MTPRRGSGITDSHVSERVISQLLTEMDGLEELHGVIILAATNRTDLIDPALLRPGRFDYLLSIPPPDEKARAEIFKIHTKKSSLASSISIEKLVAETEGCTGADIEGICREAIMLTIRRYIGSNTEREEDKRKRSKLEVTMEDFQEAIRKTKERKKSVDTNQEEPAL